MPPPIQCIYLCNSVNQKMPGSVIFMWVVPVFTVWMQLLTSVTDAIKLQKLELYFSDVLMINININNAFMTASLYLITLMQTSETEEQVRKGPRHAHYDMAFRTCATHTRNLWKEKSLGSLNTDDNKKQLVLWPKQLGVHHVFLVHLFDVHCMKMINNLMQCFTQDVNIWQMRQRIFLWLSLNLD